MDALSILVTGDFVPHGRILNLLKNKDFHSVYNDFYEQLWSSDLNITNLECPLINIGVPIKKIGPSLYAPINTTELLKYGKIEVVTLANNHILDYGKNGLKTTLEVCHINSISTVGAGLSIDEIVKPLIINKKNKKIAFLNVAESEFSIIPDLKYGANPFDLINIFRQVNQLKLSTDKIIIIVHGGHEFYKYPSPDIQKRYRFLIEIGADVVIGHHPHCYSGYEKYNDGLIFYSLGNFCFDWPQISQPSWNNGYAIKLILNKNNSVNFEIVPYCQGSETAGIKLLKHTEKQLFFDDLHMINKIITNEESLNREWKQYLGSMNDKYFSMIQPTPRIIKALQSRHLFPKLFYRNKYNRLMLLNLIRCESHREVLLNILNDTNN